MDDVLFCFTVRYSSIHRASLTSDQSSLVFFSSQALAIINYSVFTSDFMTTVLNVSSLCALTEIKSWLRHWRLVLTRELVKDRLTVRLKAQLTKWPVTIA